MKVGSLCTGYGGLEMGLQQAFGDIDLRFVSDIDKNVNKLLAHHHPNIPNLGDLTKVNWSQVEQIDLLCAGYPCQPFSLAGNRKGEEDERAIFEYIADGISVSRPRYLFLENVSGHLTLGGTSVITTLTKLGYDNIKWGVVRASDTGSPHRRERLFIWAESTDSSEEGSERAKWGRTAAQERFPFRHIAERNKELTFANSASLGQQSIRSQHRLEETTRKARRFDRFGAYESAIRRWETIFRKAPYPVDDKGVNTTFVEWMMGLPEGHVTDLNLSRTSELTILGNGVVPQQAALAIKLLTTLL